MEADFQIFHIPDQNKWVFRPGDAWACPRIYRFIFKSENVGQTISDPGQKVIVYTLRSIWQYPFFQNDIKLHAFCQNRHPRKIGFLLWGRGRLTEASVGPRRVAVMQMDIAAGSPMSDLCSKRS